MAMLEVKDLEVYYGMIQAIKGISFEVNQGEVVALIGANGAGKTTTLHTITGLLPSKKGTVTFEGQDITKVPAHKIVYMGVAHVPEGRRVFADLSVYQNLKMGAYTRKDKEEIEQTLLTLSEKIGKQRIVWRYDPIILNQTISIDYHKEQFARMCERFSHAVRSVTISFVDRYPKLKTDFIRPITSEEMQELGCFIAKTLSLIHIFRKGPILKNR